MRSKFAENNLKIKFMGCDIHTSVEIRLKSKGEHRWHNASIYKKSIYDGEFLKRDLDDDRNYTLFSILAGVRNYNDLITPISKPRGIPIDATKETINHYSQYEGYGHSASFFTLSELEAFRTINNGNEYSALDSFIKEIIEFREYNWCKNYGKAERPDFRVIFWFDN